eukprot:GHUV01017893.1.p1 GENE.GHUV01017893.1~~GHUV01017893.1.p1  ORF type:complete len:241 (+),score=57.04 GHUV01017893.1:998-1720(+)
MDRMETEGGPGAGFAGGFSGFGAQGPFSMQDILEQMFGGSQGFGAMGGGGGFWSSGGNMGGMGNLFVESSMRLTFMEAAQGTKKKVDLSRVIGTQIPPVEIDIPPGIDSGQQIQVAAPMGADPKQRINVLLSIEVEAHPKFRRQGLDVMYTQILKLHEALLGTTVTVPTIDGSAELVVPPLTMGNDVLRMREKGIQDPRGRSRGDQLVSVRIIKPSKLTERQKQLLKEFAQEAEAANVRR